MSGEIFHEWHEIYCSDNRSFGERHWSGTLETRTTRTPAFWHTPTAPWLLILVIHIRSQVKTRQSQSCQKIAKNWNLEILQETLYATHLLAFLDKIINMIWIQPEQTRDGRTDRRTDGVKPMLCDPKIIAIYMKLNENIAFVSVGIRYWAQRLGGF